MFDTDATPESKPGDLVRVKLVGLELQGIVTEVHKNGDGQCGVSILVDWTWGDAGLAAP